MGWPLKELTPHGVRHLIGRDDAHIVEIGANDGTDTFAFLSVFPKGRVTAFECDQRAIASWRRRIHIDHPRATLYETALGDRSGFATFYPSSGKPPGVQWEGIESWDKSGSLLKPDRHVEISPWIRFMDPIQVPVGTLDMWFGEGSDLISFVWMDVQGAEAAVLRGAQKTLARVKYLYCECHSHPNYHGQATLQEIRNLLPGFRFKAEYASDNYLFVNTGAS